MSDAPRQRLAGWRDAALVLIALAWMLAFGAHFFSRPLSNNSQFTRRMLLAETPWLLLDNVSPQQADAARASGWEHLPDRLDLLGVAGVILAGAWGAGHLLLRGLGVRDGERSAARTAFAMGLGFSAWSLITLGLGLCGVMSQPLMCGLIGCAVVAEVTLRIRSVKPFSRDSQGSAPRREPWWRRRYLQGSLWGPAVLVTASPFVAAMLLGSMLPPTDFDVKEYHLQGPKEWYLAGQISFLPHNVYTSFPFLAEMLPLLAMVVRGDWYRGALAGQVVLMTFAPLTACAVFAAGQFISRRAGWLAVLILLTTPWIYRISVIAYAEGGLTFYLAVSLLSVMRLRFARLDGDRRRREVLLCGLLAGSAMACKYPGVVSVVIPLGAAIVWMTLKSESLAGSTNSLSIAVRTGLLFSAGVCATFGPWALKNMVQTGNPVYPLLYSVFGGRDWDAELNAKWKAGHSPSAESFRPAAILPSIAAHAQDVAVGSDWQSVLIFALAPLSLFLLFDRRPNSSAAGAAAPASHRIASGWLLYAVWLFLTWWALTHRIDRFWVPMLPVLCLLGGAGLDAVLNALDKLRQRGGVRSAQAGWIACLAPIAVAVAFNLAIVTSPIAGNNNYLVARDLARRDALTPCIGVIHRHVPEGARVLMIGEAAVFDALFDPVYDTVFDRSLFQQWTGEDGTSLHDPDIPLRDPDAIRATLAEHRVTHVFVNWLEILRYREPGSYGYTEFVSPRRLKALVDLGILRPVPLDPAERSVPLDSLSPGKQAVVHEWGPELQFVAAGEPFLVAYQLFEVR